MGLHQAGGGDRRARASLEDRLTRIISPGRRVTSGTALWDYSCAGGVVGMFSGGLLGAVDHYRAMACSWYLFGSLGQFGKAVLMTEMALDKGWPILGLSVYAAIGMYAGALLNLYLRSRSELGPK